MKITPQEITAQEFKIKMKGFDQEEVKNFLLQISELMEMEILEKEKVKNDHELLKDKILKYEKREEILRDTLVSAQKFSNEIKSTAEREAELIIKEAEMKSDEIINQAISRQRDLKEEIRNLKFKRKEIEAEILNMLNSLKELIETYRKSDNEFDKVEYLGK